MKNIIKTKDAKKGGYLVGKSHAEGGIKGINVDTGEPIEVEGGEVVITKPAVDSQKKYTFEGKQMTPKEIMSKLNSDHGGVEFAKGGTVGNKYSNGGAVGAFEMPPLDEFKDRYRNRKFVLPPSNDDISDEIYPIEKLISSLNYETTPCNDIRKINYNADYLSRVFVINIILGDFVILKKVNNRKISDQYEVNKRLLAKYPNGYDYDFTIPWQIMDITMDTNRWQTITFKRIVNGELEECIIPESDRAYDNFVFLSNFCGIVSDNLANEAPYLPYENNSGFSDNWAIGEIILAYNKEDGNVWNSETYCYLISDSIYSYIRQTDGYTYSYKTRNRGVDFFNDPNNNGEHNYLMVGDIAVIDLYQNTSDIYKWNFDLEQKIILTEALVKSGGASDFGGEKYKVKLNASEMQVEIAHFVLHGTDNHSYVVFVYNNDMYYTKYDNIRVKEMVSFAENSYGATTNDIDKQILKAKKKDTTNAARYNMLSKIVDAEITKLSVLRGVLIEPSTKSRQNQIDKKLAELQEQRDMYYLQTNTGSELLDKFAALETQAKVENEPTRTSMLAINGRQSELTDAQYTKVRTPKFLEWFGDWMRAYETNNYGNVSKTINPNTAEPLVLYHGSRADFVRWRFDEFPAAYFADNRSYAQWFSNVRGGGILYQVFVKMVNPIDVRDMGINKVPIRDILDRLKTEYNIDKYDACPRIKEYEIGGQEAVDRFLDTTMSFWQFIRHLSPQLLTYLRDKTFYDGVMMFEDNIQDIVNGEPNVTGSFVVFRRSQVKWASANHFNNMVEDSRFEKGGRIDDLNHSLDNIDFAF
jgi:hypothetical protein